MKSKLEKAILDSMIKNPNNYWKGFVYLNRKDPRIIVPRGYSWMGWTLNFASPYSYITLICIILITIAAIIIL
jgi:uncharacterized membrane protein